MMDAIIEAVNIIEMDECDSYRSSNYMPVYLFTTENISGILKGIDVSNKNILTVSSSGDHIFNMLLKGAKSIETYDINYFTKYYYYFKEAAIKTLSYEEFLGFFFKTKFSFKNRVFDDKMVLRVLSNIKDNNAKLFWLYLFGRYGGKKLYSSGLFINNYEKVENYTICNDYLSNRDNYNKLKMMLNDYDYTFYLVDIFDNVNGLKNKKYDFIYLSNILEKLYCNTELEYVSKVRDIISSVKECLTEDGILGVCYLYYYMDGYWDVLSNRRLNSPEVRHKYFKDGYDYEYFNGFSTIKSNLEKNRDALMLTLKK